MLIGIDETVIKPTSLWEMFIRIDKTVVKPTSLLLKERLSSADKLVRRIIKQRHILGQLLTERPQVGWFHRVKDKRRRAEALRVPLSL